MEQNRSYIKFPQLVVVKAPGLLNMMYKVGELAEALKVPDDTLRSWLDLGAPHTRDEQGHIWIVGVDFATWVECNRKPKPSGKKLADGEGYCLRCKQPVQLINPKIRHVVGKLIHKSGTCPQCGGTVITGGRCD